MLLPPHYAPPKQCQEGDHDLDPHETPFDIDKACKMTSHEVRMKWPRRTCKRCGSTIYDSFDHYIAGDW